VHNQPRQVVGKIQISKTSVKPIDRQIGTDESESHRNTLFPHMFII